MLFNHDRDEVIGKITKAWIDNGRGMATIEFDSDEASEVIYQKVKGGTLREGLAAAVAADTETWIQNAKEAEASGEQPSELEILTKTVTKQQAQIESINQSVDDITLAILGGE